MKLATLTKLDKRKTTSLLFVEVMTNLKQLGRRIPDSRSIILTFLVITTFYITKTEIRPYKSLP